MSYYLASFKKWTLLDPNKHKNFGVRKVDSFEFLKNIEMVPLGLSELIPVCLFYPVIFKTIEDNSLSPFAVVSIKKKSFYITDENYGKINVIPQICNLYPFGIYKKSKEFMIVIEKEHLIPFSEDRRGQVELIFDEHGNETEVFKKVKQELTYFIKDFLEAKEFSNELYKEGCLKQVNVAIDTIWGKVVFKNVFLGDIEGLYRMQPEKLYYFNNKGFLPLLYAVFFSIRNFELLKIVAKEIVISQSQISISNKISHKKQKEFSEKYEFEKQGNLPLI